MLTKFARLTSRVHIIFILLVLVFAVLLFYLVNKVFLSNYLNINDVSTESIVKVNKTTVYSSLYKPKGYLYKSSQNGINAVMDFITKNPSYKTGTKILPDNFINNTKLTRQSDDKTDPFLTKRNINLTNEHYFFNQKIEGIPVYDATLSIHLRNKNEIYSIDGNLVTDQKIDIQKITEDKAIQIAMEKAYKEAPAEKLKTGKTQKYIFNKKILGLEEDGKNYLTLEVRIDSDKQFLTFSKSYFISLNSGEIIYEVERIFNALSRQIYRCTGSCQVVRNEGSGPTGDSDGDKAYDFFGDIYNYYSSNFQRDSYDNAGATFKGYVHSAYQLSCPNAAWTGTEMLFCDGMVTKDITGHELTHAVTNYTANLEYSYQSGALNESVSDIFGSLINDGKWTMGEGSVLGIIRYLDDPPKMGQPDRVFSSNYYCGGSDSGGVHKNSGVMNKAFFLMTQGASFNGCSVNGIGGNKSGAIVYYALTRHLTASSNFKEMYNALLASCGELYQTDSSVCENVKTALQATEMDQQPANQQQGARCGGTRPVTPQCAGGTAPTNPLDNSNPTPTGSAITPTTAPTTAPLSYMIFGNVYRTTGEKISGAGLKLSGDTSRKTTTDSGGNYSFDILEQKNEYSVGYIVTLEYTSPQTLSKTIFLTPDSPRVMVDFPVEIGTVKPPIITTPTNAPAPTARPSQSPTSGASPTSSTSVSPTPDGGGGGGGGGDGTIPTDEPTPTPIPYTCVPDQDCLDKSGQSNIQLCPLKCTPL